MEWNNPEKVLQFVFTTYLWAFRNIVWLLLFVIFLHISLDLHAILSAAITQAVEKEKQRGFVFFLVVLMLE
jgi:predicted ABC-type ATPase